MTKELLINYYEYLLKNASEILDKIKKSDFDDDKLSKLSENTENMALSLSNMINTIDDENWKQVYHDAILNKK